MIRIKTIMVCLLTALSCVGFADTYSCITIGDSGGEKSYEITDIEKITFDSGYMNIALTSGSTVQLELSTLETIDFSTQNSISVPQADAMMLSSGTLLLRKPGGARVFLYSAGGMLMKTVSTTADETKIDLSTLKNGVYIVRVGDTVKKILNNIK